jgi:enoyl-CoA hydratase/carnithine racemase
MEEILLVEVHRRVALVTLNRPAARNALSAALRRALPSTLRELDADGTVDVIVMTGTDPAFCAGIDLKELGGPRPDGSDEVDELVRRGAPFGPLSKPLVGAINGVAITGGLEIALNCDFLVASERARFADTHARVGIQPGWGLTVLLPQAVGVRRAREMSLTGNFVDAATALEWGLVNRVVAHDELLPTSLALAADIVSNDAAGVRRILRTYAEEAALVTGPAQRIETEVSMEWLRSGGGRPEEVERRRTQIVERGRTQLG